MDSGQFAGCLSDEDLSGVCPFFQSELPRKANWNCDEAH
jgi:hypothetical protein